MTVKREPYAARGCPLSVLRGGAGPRLLYLHGLEASGEAHPFLQSLSDSFEVFAPEHPGFGNSADADWLENIHDLAYFYLDLIESFGPEPIHVAGSSIGGWIALEMAVRNTTRIKSLSLAAPAGIYAEGLRRGDIFLWPAEERLRNSYFNQAHAETAIATLDPIGNFDANYKSAVSLARIAWEPRLFDPALKKWLHRVTCPTQIIWGANDKILPPGYAREFAQLIPGSHVEMIPECGHLLALEQSARFATLVTTFAKAHDQ